MIIKTSGSNPNRPDVIELASDQGAIITVNGGQTWSSWYNQPTAQLYHVSADNSFPYRLYSGQQESGSVGIASRGADGAITFRDWHPVGAEEYGYVVPDALDPDITYGGKLTRHDRRTGQTQEVLPIPLRSVDFSNVAHAADCLLAARSSSHSFSPPTYFAGRRVMVDKIGRRSARIRRARCTSNPPRSGNINPIRAPK